MRLLPQIISTIYRTDEEKENESDSGNPDASWEPDAVWIGFQKHNPPARGFAKWELLGIHTMDFLGITKFTTLWEAPANDL